jgi:nucleotide-binding universal stress UspA family protein
MTAPNPPTGLSIDLAHKYAAELHVLAVAQPPVYGDEVETEAVLENALRRREESLHPLRARVVNESPLVHFEVVVGHPAHQIVRYAEANAIDHIVVGHRGHTLLERWLIGSIARHVLANAPCSVTVTRQLRRRQRDRLRFTLFPAPWLARATLQFETPA